MNITYVTESYPPHSGWGGIGTYVFHMATALAANGHKVTVVCRQSNGPLVQNGVKVLRLIKSFSTPQMREEVCSALTRLIDEQAQDIIEFPEYQALGLNFQLQRPNQRTIVRLHGNTLLAYLGDLAPVMRLVRKFATPNSVRSQNASEVETVKRANAVSAPSRWAVDVCQSAGWPLPLRIHVYPNPEQPRARGTEYGTGPQVTFLGRLDRRKGADLIPSVINQIHKKHPSIRFTIVGQDTNIPRFDPHARHGTYSNYINNNVVESAKSLVCLVGGIQHDRISEYLRAGDIACFMSTWETLGYTHTEAMAHGVACVVGSVGGAQEIGVDGIHVLKVSRSPQAVASAANNLIADPTLRDKIANSARDLIEHAFSSKAILPSAIAAYYYGN